MDQTKNIFVDIWGLKLIHAETLDKFIERPFRRLCLEVYSDLCRNDYMYTTSNERDTEYNMYGVIGETWRSICKIFGFSDLVMGIGFIILAVVANVLATPSLVIGLVLLVWIWKKKERLIGRFGVLVRVHVKEMNQKDKAV